MRRVLLLLLITCPTSTHNRASVTVTPGRSQYFEYEEVSVSCEQLGSDGWTVWRYSTNGLELSQCGSGWGSQTSSSCDMNTVKLSNSGVYWCESTYRDSSNAVNITITDKDVILHSPVLPVTEGQDVTLRCQTKTASNLQAHFYRNDIFIGTGPTGHVVVHNVSKSDEGAYRCNIIGHGASLTSWLLIRDEVDPAALTASPDSAQLFEYDNLSLHCGDNSSVHGWRVRRFTTTVSKLSSCGQEWGTVTDSGCILQTAKQPDSAVYWCESPARQRSNSLSITVYDKPVILQSPVLPVSKGLNITLRCRAKNPSPLPAAFYKDGSLIGTAPAGHMTIHHISRTDEGLYKCDINDRGESPSSRLFVRAPHGAAPHSQVTLSVLSVIRYVVVCSPYFISTVLMVSLYRQRPAGSNPPVSMTMSPRREEGEGCDPQYDDVIAAVPTEHHF